MSAENTPQDGAGNIWYAIGLVVVIGVMGLVSWVTSQPPPPNPPGASSLSGPSSVVSKGGNDSVE